ncbi:ubiquitin carboxyl-terminal hydrolase 47-like isoform X2 [Parambassis ranga]|uniref:Ubiquitin carboxyl-terminal hydrolase 47-like isoform X2 n=1 Tax=Parambassis ranga TaxID=210632 RepID=A0A6P7K665_9TELE|nr:ubiquitin carboxyl-terminal hydrolase 47-like isoform X2 [Parambassis ranga]
MSLLGNGVQYVYSSLFANPGPQYHGLKNQGATDYLNSVLQVLFMTKDFREAVKRYRSESPGNEEEHMDGLLSAMFEVLERETAQTNDITTTLGIERVYEQQDAAEYFQRILQLTSHEASRIFHGMMSHRTSCHECDKEADVDGPFWYLPLALMDSSSDVYSVEDGIEQFFRTSEFRGENQMYCDLCDDKVDASTKYVIKHHPDVLMLLLKRFDFSYRHMSYVKINCAVNVPLMLQIPEGQTYELYAVVDHAGDLRSGHYNATIKSEDDGRWYWFDDTSVRVLYNQPFQYGNTEQSQMAYLLFYRKKKSTMDHVVMEVCLTSSCSDDVRQRGSDGHQDSVANRSIIMSEDANMQGNDGNHEESVTAGVNVGREVAGEMNHTQSRDQENEGDTKQNQRRAGSERPGRPTESQSTDEEAGQETSQTTATEGEQGSKQKELKVQVFEDTYLITPCDKIELIQTEIIETKTLKLTLQGSSDREVGGNEASDNSTCSDPKQFTTNSQEESETAHSNADRFYSEAVSSCYEKEEQTKEETPTEATQEKKS